jgi:hypothetical protein
MDSSTKNTSGASGGSSNQDSAASGSKKDGVILDAFLPRIESRGQSRQLAPKKDDARPKGQGSSYVQNGSAGDQS